MLQTVTARLDELLHDFIAAGSFGLVIASESLVAPV